MIIYKITNTVDGKIYIGQTVQTLSRRWKNHIAQDGRRRSQSYLYNAIRHHGADNFTVEQIDTASTLEGLNALEQFYIVKFNCLAPNGYNLESGGMNHRCHADTKEKLRTALKGRPFPNRWDKGRSLPHSEETKQKLSESLKGRVIENRWAGGNRTPRTDEQKAHLSSLIKGKPNVALHKKVQCVETGEIFESVNAAAAAFNVNRVTISGLLKSGKQGGKLATKGRSFRFC